MATVADIVLCVKLLGIEGDNKGIRGFGWQIVFQAKNFMPGLPQRIEDSIGDPMVCEESQPILGHYQHTLGTLPALQGLTTCRE